MDKNRGKGLVRRIKRLLDLLETDQNQALIQRIKGLLNEILES